MHEDILNEVLGCPTFNCGAEDARLALGQQKLVAAVLEQGEGWDLALCYRVLDVGKKVSLSSPLGTPGQVEKSIPV